MVINTQPLDALSRSDVQIFFNTLLPEIIKERAHLFASIRGSIAFIIEGEGMWTVRFANFAQPLVNDAAFDADLVMTFRRGAFSQLLDGDAIDLDRDVVCLGDTEIFSRFGRLLVEPARGVAGPGLMVA